MPLSGVSGAGVPEVLAALFAELSVARGAEVEGAELASLADAT